MAGEEDNSADIPFGAEPEQELGESTGTAVAPEERPAPPVPGQLPPYKVLLHNDEVNDFAYVIRTVAKLTPLSVEEALEKTWEAHASGVSLLLVTHLERAELYCEQFASCRLTVTAEPDD